MVLDNQTLTPLNPGRRRSHLNLSPSREVIMFASFLLASSLAGLVLGANQQIIVGGANGLVFTPSNITAAIGDTVGGIRLCQSFVLTLELDAGHLHLPEQGGTGGWLGTQRAQLKKLRIIVQNHTVTQSSFAAPCTLLQNATSGASGFDSSYVAVAVDATENPAWTLQVEVATVSTSLNNECVPPVLIRRRPRSPSVRLSASAACEAARFTDPVLPNRVLLQTRRALPGELFPTKFLPARRALTGLFRREWSAPSTPQQPATRRALSRLTHKYRSPPPDATDVAHRFADYLALAKTQPTTGAAAGGSTVVSSGVGAVATGSLSSVAAASATASGASTTPAGTARYGFLILNQHNFLNSYLRSATTIKRSGLALLACALVAISVL